MIGVDTNVLVRLLVRDNPAQLDAAARFMAQRSADDPAFVSSVVVAEFAWVLDKSYGYASEAIHGAMDWLFDSENIVVERSDLIENAVLVAREANADISDAIIAALAEDAGASKTATFDRNAAKRIPGMDLLA
jgi:predicted nucleic-acid-binding protein